MGELVGSGRLPATTTTATTPPEPRLSLRLRTPVLGATPTVASRAHGTGCVHLLVAAGGEDIAGSVMSAGSATAACRRSIGPRSADPSSSAACSDGSRRVLLLGLGVVRWHPWDAVGAGASRESAVTLPERDVAKGWQGRLVLDQDGERLGECTGIFADAASGATEWLEVAVEGHRRCLLPALNALEVGGQVRVAFRRAAVLAAPHVGDDTELSKRDDIVLYRHYGVHYSAAASPSLLPTEADLGQPKTADLPVTPTAKTADLPVPPTGKADRDTSTQPPPPPSVLPPRPPLVEADTRPHVVQAPTPIRRPSPAAPTPVWAVPTFPVSPGPTASSTSPQASPAPTPPPTHPPGPQAEADDPPVAAPKPMPAPIRPPAPAHVAKPAQPVPGTAASRAGESSPGRDVSSQPAQSASSSPGADAPGSGAEPLGPLAGAWASGAPLVALAALAAAVAFGLRARDQRVAVGRPTSAGRRGRPAPSRTRTAPSRTRTAPAARRPTSSTFGTAPRKPRVGAAAGPAKHGGSVGRSVRRQLRRLATAGACAAGYLRGARAGRQRYDQLRTHAEQLAQHPQVQAARQAVTDPQARKQALAQTRERYRSSQEQYRSARRQATELVAHPQVRRYRQAVTDPQVRQQVITELRAHPQVQHYRQAITDLQVRQQVLTELRDKAEQVAAALKKQLG